MPFVRLSPTPDYISPPDTKPWGGALLRNEEGIPLRRISPPWPWEGELTDAEYEAVRRLSYKLECQLIGETVDVPEARRVVTVIEIADRAGKGIGPARVIKAAAALGIELYRDSEVAVSQAEDILAHIRGE